MQENPKAKTKPLKNGGNRMLELGKKPVQLWLTQAQYDAIRQAADEEMRPMTTLILSCVMASLKRRASDECS